MKRPLRFGVHAGPSDNPYSARRDYWCEAERLGYDWASVSDHFIANPVFGARDTDPWNEAWTSLAALAEATSRIHIGVTRERSDFVGQHYTLTGAVCEPKPVQRPHPPIWVGGMGEKKTLRVVAERRWVERLPTTNNTTPAEAGCAARAL